MHQGFHRARRRRGAPAPPKRHKAQNRASPRPSSGFEGLISEAIVPSGRSGDFFFSDWLKDPDSAAEYLEHGEERENIASDPRVGVSASALLHILIVLFLLFEPALDILHKRDQQDAAEKEKKNPLVLFLQKPKVPQQQPPSALVLPVVPKQQPKPAPEKPPQVADNRMVIPKAMIPAPDEHQKFMNDLPFSKGNTDQFYTDKEVKEPGKEGETKKKEPEEPKLVPEPGEADKASRKSEGADSGNEGTEAAAKKLAPSDLGELLFGTPRQRDEAHARSNMPPPDSRLEPDKEGQGGQNGAFTDIRRFLAGARFENPEGGLVSNTNNSMYYNDKGANFVPWLTRMLAEVRRNWLVPYSVSFNHGHVAIGLTVTRDGSVTDLRILVPSGVSGFDNAAVGALRASRLLPLPADYPDPTFDMILVFWYNERPYDLFG